MSDHYLEMCLHTSRDNIKLLDDANVGVTVTASRLVIEDKFSFTPVM